MREKKNYKSLIEEIIFHMWDEEISSMMSKYNCKTVAEYAEVLMMDEDALMEAIKTLTCSVTQVVPEVCDKVGCDDCSNYVFQHLKNLKLSEQNPTAAKIKDDNSKAEQILNLVLNSIYFKDVKYFLQEGDKTVIKFKDGGEITIKK